MLSFALTTELAANRTTRPTLRAMQDDWGTPKMYFTSLVIDALTSQLELISERCAGKGAMYRPGRKTVGDLSRRRDILPGFSIRTTDS